MEAPVTKTKLCVVLIILAGLMGAFGAAFGQGRFETKLLIVLFTLAVLVLYDWYQRTQGK